MLHSDVYIKEEKDGLMTKCFRQFREQSNLSETITPFGVDLGLCNFAKIYICKSQINKLKKREYSKNP